MLGAKTFFGLVTGPARPAAISVARRLATNSLSRVATKALPTVSRRAPLLLEDMSLRSLVTDTSATQQAAAPSTSAPKRRVMVLGGYGTFGTKISERLAQDPDISLMICGRSHEKALNLVQDIQKSGAPAELLPFPIDINKGFLDKLRSANPEVVINAAGPYNAGEYGVAEACIENGSHYIDLADGRAFVEGISDLDAAAKAKGVVVISGASTVPGLSSAALESCLPEFSHVDCLDYCISPGNQTPRGLSTVRSILSYVGKPFQTLVDGQMTDVIGWQDLRKVDIPEVGRRWISNCNIPDLGLFPQRYPEISTIKFGAGLELSTLHLGLWGLSALPRIGAIKSLEPAAKTMLQASEVLYPFGSKRAGMKMTLTGKDHAKKPLQIDWSIHSNTGDGPQIPCTASVLLTKKILDGSLNKRGSTPCMGLFNVGEFMGELKPFDIHTVKTATPKSV
ncbi:MAG: hypothetical protein ACI9BD_000780 [Candidatus Marinamargulisbacteria bacterium]|jgi:hypothetical protein